MDFGWEVTERTATALYETWSGNLSRYTRMHKECSMLTNLHAVFFNDAESGRGKATKFTKTLAPRIKGVCDQRGSMRQGVSPRCLDLYLWERCEVFPQKKRRRRGTEEEEVLLRNCGKRGAIAEWLCHWICLERSSIFPLRTAKIGFFEPGNASGHGYTMHTVTVPAMQNSTAFMDRYTVLALFLMHVHMCAAL